MLITRSVERNAVFMKVLYAVSEARPFIASGGLGVVSGSLPPALAQKGIDIRVILPKHSAIPKKLRDSTKDILRMKVQLAWRSQDCNVQEAEYNGITYYLIDNEYYFTREKLYGEYDDAERYAFFCRAVLECLPHIGFKPDVIHCHDWQTSLIPTLMHHYYSTHPFYHSIKTLFTIHNMKHQGVFAGNIMGDVVGMEETQSLWENVEFEGVVNLMKGAIYCAEAVSTVSPTYAAEIQYPYFGMSLDGVVRDNYNKLHGILNGIDTQLYNPQKDPAIFVRYRNAYSKKVENKMHLQARLKLPVSENTPLLCFVARLDEQKGIDLIIAVFEELMSLGVQLIVYGRGEDEQYKDFFVGVAEHYPEQLCAMVDFGVSEFDEELERCIMAGSDMLLMPSRFEPCGISQMIAMRYGTLPIVRETGGLVDTVDSYNTYTGEGNGFSFANYNAHDMLNVIKLAVDLYRNDESAWNKLFRQALSCDNSWSKSADAYVELYSQMCD